MVVARFRWDLHSFVLMPNHYHLLLATPAPTLSQGMRQLGGVYSQRFNRRWSRCGHLFQVSVFSTYGPPDAGFFTTFPPPEGVGFHDLSPPSR